MQRVQARQNVCNHVMQQVLKDALESEEEPIYCSTYLYLQPVAQDLSPLLLSAGVFCFTPYTFNQRRKMLSMFGAQ
jgi:hypothetical protein